MFVSPLIAVAARLAVIRSTEARARLVDRASAVPLLAALQTYSGAGKGDHHDVTGRQGRR
jgi:hypothetical protein